METSKWRALFLAARPKTLTASLVPILVGSSFSYFVLNKFLWWVAVLALLGSLFIQIATNLFNDAIDFIKGADTETRLGEARATQSGWLSHRKVMLFGGVSLFLALLCGIPLVIHGGLPILIIGLVSLFMGYSYTGGPFPLAYLGLGDLFVLIFFGWIAVGGVVFLHAGVFDLSVFVLGTQVGLLSTVMIAINNIRDQEQDRLVNKKTLSVRLGRFSKWEIVVLYILVFAINIYWLYLEHLMAFALTTALLIPAFVISKRILNAKPSTQFNQFLAKGSMIYLLFGLLFSLGLSLK